MKNPKLLNTARLQAGGKTLPVVAAWIGLFTAATGLAQPAVAHNVGYRAKLVDGGPAIAVDPDQSVELALKIKRPFTVVGVGDLLQFQPFAANMDPDIQYLIKIIQDADLAVGDLENEVYDFDNFAHAGFNLGTKEVADDWALMGIDMVSRANNKDQRAPGIWENFRQMERVGIVHLGVAHSLPEARMARYRGTTKGLAGMVGIYSKGGTDPFFGGGAFTYVTAEQLAQLKIMKATMLARRDEVEVPAPDPLPDPEGTVNVFGVTFKLGPKPEGDLPKPVARRGLFDTPSGPPDGMSNALRVTQFNGVTAEQMAQLRAIANDAGTGSDLKAFGTQFRVMDRPGELSYDMNPEDRNEILTQIRTGKQASDIMVSNMHWHQNRYAFQAYSHDHFPADFEIKFAHDAIDQGDDVFIAEGVHTIKGVEIYKGKPIFYGVSNFIFQSAIMPQGKGRYPAVPGQKPRENENLRAPGHPTREAGPGEIVGEHEVQGFFQLKPNMEALLAYSQFENGKLAEVRIYPVDLGQTPRPGSQFGIPKRPAPEVAKKILGEVIEYSKPFGTKITIEDGVGIIRIP